MHGIYNVKVVPVSVVVWEYAFRNPYVWISGIGIIDVDNTVSWELCSL